MRQKKKLAGKLLKTSPKKVVFAGDAIDDIGKAITRSDMRGLIAVGKVSKRLSNEHSRAGARRNAAQKRKGRQKGRGSKKGSQFAIVTGKEQWMAKIRVQRIFLKELRDKKLVSTQTYRQLYGKSKGGYFRNKRHIKLYLTEHQLVRKTAGVES